ncbi:hypothetical protein BDFB_011808 [Asbolus verrucosus]|uniref:Uncharacterized protein n=1 Tax=Asbolus verrucosus TaxID=1661398 RepID=A0A482VQ23_ASBVE|nr:hypothetical protein BDFB_011808 [Asbolus verrucosus]
MLLVTLTLVKNISVMIAENYNSVLAKFIGGKRVDYAKKKGYEMRCNLAGLFVNCKSEFYDGKDSLVLWEHMQGEDFYRSKKNHQSYVTFAFCWKSRHKLWQKPRTDSKKRTFSNLRKENCGMYKGSSVLLRGNIAILNFGAQRVFFLRKSYIISNTTIIFQIVLPFTSVKKVKVHGARRLGESEGEEDAQEVSR